MAARYGHSAWRWWAPPLLVLALIGAGDVGASGIGASGIGASDIGASGVGARDIGARDIGDVVAPSAGPRLLVEPQRAGTCGTDPAPGGACASSGPAQWVHTLGNLDPTEGQGSAVVCTYDGKVTLSLDGQPIETADGELYDGMWQILYEGQTTHSEQGGMFVCEGGGTNSAIVLAGTYTVAPLEFVFDEAFQCADDQFDFDGATVSAVINNFCNPNRADVVSFTITLGAGQAEEPAGTDAVETSEPGGSEPSLPTSVVATSEPGGTEPSLPTSATLESGSSGGSSDGGLGPVALAAIVAAILAVLAGAVVGVRKLPGRSSPPGSVSAPPDAPAPPAPEPVAPEPVAPEPVAPALPAPAPPAPGPPPPTPLFPTPPSLPGAEEQAQPSQLSEAERARLEGIRGEIQAEVAQQIEAYQRAKRERAVLTRILKQNLLKVFMKKVIETQKWISLDPKNLLSNIGEQVTPDSLKIMDRIFQKHDTSHDAEIISSMKAEVDRLQAEMNEHIGNVRDLRQEISRLDQRMGR